MKLDGDTCYRALEARDARFDGCFFVGVATTGIYCRPVCTARTPRRDRCSFFRTAAEAEQASFRACFRCRPELAPGLGSIDAISRLAALALERIQAGCLNEGSVDDLAAELGVTGRHLRRALGDELGVSPVRLADARRLALAKQLLAEGDLSLAEIAFASGFGSVRRFNASFAARFGRPPSDARRRTGRAAGARRDDLVLRLDYRPPLAWEPLVGFLAARAIPGVEVVREGRYLRAVAIGSARGVVVVGPAAKRDALEARVPIALTPALLAITARLRALFDLDAHPDVVAAHLSANAGPTGLAELCARTPGLRVPGTFEPFETAARAVLGQQVSVAAATTLAGRLALALGEPLDSRVDGIHLLFPTAARVAGAGEREVAAIGMPAARARALVALATAMPKVLAARGDPERARAELLALPGVGPWTAEYLAMRVLAWPDAFPASDLALRRSVGGLDAKALFARAEAWRPFRSYAAMHLWNSDSSTTKKNTTR